MRKLFSFAAVVLSVMLIVVSCAPASLQNDASDKVDLYFGYLDAKAVNTDIYDSSGEAEWGSATVLVGTVNDYYWSYTAEKKDSLFTYGATSTQLACATGTGLGGSRSFSKGDWKFILYAYKSAEERTGGEKYIYTGTASGSFTSDQSVSIGMNYAYGNGTGTASFSITTNIVQDQPDKAITAYKITKIEAVIGVETVTLSNSSGNTWTGTKDLTSGAKFVGLKVYVENNTTPIITSDSLGTAYILHGLTTEIAGTATISFKDARRTVNFSVMTPEVQPKLYTITYDLNGGKLAEGVVNPAFCYEGQVITPAEPIRDYESVTDESISDYLYKAGTATTSYTFKGWKVLGADDSTASKTYIAAANDVKLEAVWKPSTTGGEIKGKNLSAGTSFTLGTYPDTYTNSSEVSVFAGSYVGQPVEWKVLEVDEMNCRALIISEKILTYGAHNSYGQWTNSDIRTWLNNTGSDGFISKYGLDSVSIASVEISTENLFNTEKTTDKVFLLANHEMSNLFTDDTTQIAYDLSGSAGEWWLRNGCMSDSYYMTYVSSDGSIAFFDGVSSATLNGIRPVFWLETECTYQTYTITYTGGRDKDSFPVTSYIRGSSSDTEISITFPNGTRPLTITGTLSGVDYTSMCNITDPSTEKNGGTCVIPLTIAEDVTISCITYLPEKSAD